MIEKIPSQVHGARAPSSLEKTPTGIEGLDELTFGGLPTGRPTLLCGAAGCGKTLFGVSFLVKGSEDHGEPGVFMSFEEREDELATNVASLGYDLTDLVERGQLVIDHVRIERAEIEQAGEYDLEGLFVRLGHAIDTIGAKRVVLDTVEALFAGLEDSATLRSELRRLFAFLKAKGVTAIVTAERGEGQLTRYGIEEYVSDCVILLDNRVIDQVTTRRLRVVKYRGSSHGTNEYPFLIDEQGITVLPITSAGLAHEVSSEVISTGVEGLDAMLGRHGYFRGSSVLVSGSAGTGKSTLAASFANAACARGERTLYFAFEESAAQIARNMASVGLDLERHRDAGLLKFEAARPSLYGFEMHLARMYRDIEAFDPQIVIVDPISAFRGPAVEVNATLLRLADVCKSRGTTALFTSLSSPGVDIPENERAISSLMDTWITLADMEANGERNRILSLVKTRGMNHSKQLREYRLGDNGIEMVPVYIGPDGVLTGTARVAQEAREREDEVARQNAIAARRRAVERRRITVERQIAELQAELENEEAEVTRIAEQDVAQTTHRDAERNVMSTLRGGL